ncbi:hypothetical protein [Celeribacter sp.]|uniref:hypothetical protein n=1 Tax=Celeribacter sp. TaxID=1890673 RepID=UPI003A94D83A
MTSTIKDRAPIWRSWGALTALCASGVVGAHADDVNGSHRPDHDGMTFTVGAEVWWEDNPNLSPSGGDGIFAAGVPLSYSLGWSSPTTWLTIDADTGIEFSEGDTRWYEPDVDVTFGHETARTRLTATADYARHDVTSSGYSTASDGRADYTAGTGMVTQAGAKLRFDGGLYGPLTYGVELSQRVVDFSEPNSATQYDNTTAQVVGSLGATLRPGTRVTLDADYTRFSGDDPDATERHDATVDVSLYQDIDRVTQARVMVGYADLETRSRVGEDSRSEFPFLLQLRRETKSGLAHLTYSTKVNTDGAWQTLEMSRNIKTRNGEVSWALGAVRTDVGDLRPIGHLAVETEGPNDALAFEVRRSFGYALGGEKTITNRATVSYDHQFDDVSGLGLSLNAVALDGEMSSAAKLASELVYRRALLDDVTMEAGVRVNVLDAVDADLAQSNSVFFAVKKSFQTR